MPNFREKLETRREQYKEDLESIILDLRTFRKRLKTSSQYEKQKIQKHFDETIDNLRKLQYLIGLIIDLDIKSINETTMMAMEFQFTDMHHMPDKTHISSLLVKMGELAEIFYYSAHHVCASLEKLTFKCHAEGVESVKNFLYEHPEIVSRSIGSSMDDSGPKLKSELVERHNTDKKAQFNDKGLYVNFDEFIDTIKSVLKLNKGI